MPALTVGVAATVLDDEAVYRARTTGDLRLAAAPRLIDLFAGAGGLTLGFSRAFGHRFVPVWANGLNEQAAATYSRNFGAHCATEDIVDLLNSGTAAVLQADMVTGGPARKGPGLFSGSGDAGSRAGLHGPE